ncbi:MAG: polysaccharide biosynthesis protein PslG, partial [Actinomycetota bacterium]|nr:polysaccharide biosynthesis protein PslG [Actinomycetota bacterium]
ATQTTPTTTTTPTPTKTTPTTTTPTTTTPTTTDTTPTSTTPTTTTPTTTDTTPTTTTPTTTDTTPTSTTAAPAPSTYFGFNDNAVGFGQTTAATDASLAAQIGANTSRVTLDWRYAEPTQGTWKLSSYDAIYTQDLAKGIRPVFILLFSPQWAFADPTVCSDTVQSCRYPPGPTHLDAWRDAVTKLVTRYPQMAALEVWNEPNLASFWKGGLDPAYYTTLLGEAYNAAHAAGSSVPILGGALSNYTDPDSATAMNYRSYLKGMYTAGAKGKMDGLSLHPYPDDIDLWRIFKTLTEVRDIRDANGDSTPLWLTEAGVTTSAPGSNYTFNENDQALMLRKIYSELTAMKDVRATILHTLIDPSVFATTSAEYGYGTMHVDLSPKPAFCALAAARGTTYSCPSTVAPLTDMPTQQLRWAAQDYVQAAADAARVWYRTHNTYVGLDPTQLHAIDPTLSATGADQALLPGATADPSRVGVWVWGTAGAENLLLCNTSKADRSYCIETQAGNQWVYGKAEGNVNAAAGATSNGSIWWW